MCSGSRIAKYLQCPVSPVSAACSSAEPAESASLSTAVQPLRRSSTRIKAPDRLACVARVSVGLGSKERPSHGILPARNWGESQNKKEGVGERKAGYANAKESIVVTSRFDAHVSVRLN